MRRKRIGFAAAAVACAAFAAWVAVATAAPARPAATKVTLQLKWVTQAQFAGYYAALEKGFYDKAGLDVTIKVGGPSITPETVVAGKRAEFGLDWLPNLFATRDNFRQHVVDLSQLTRVVQSTGTGSLSSQLGADLLDGASITYVGISLGGVLGTLFTAASPVPRYSVLNVAGGDLVGVLSTAPAFAPRFAVL